MTQLDVPTAAARLGELIAAAAAGEEVVIADASGRPVARLVATSDDDVASGRRRLHGLYEGRITMSDDFNAPLTGDELKEWGL